MTPTIPMDLTIESVPLAVALADLDRSGTITIDPAIASHIIAADALDRAYRVAMVGVTGLRDRAVQREAQDRLIHDAATGRVDLAVCDMIGEHEATLAAAKTRVAVCRLASNEATHTLRTSIRDGSAAIGGQLEAALVATLDAAAPPVRVLGDAGLDWSDPGALAGSEPAVATAWRLASELAVRHDLLRRAAVLLVAEAPSWPIAEPERVALAVQRLTTGQDAAWEECGSFVGHGVRMMGPADRRWTWAPTGHPVARLVAAVEGRRTPLPELPRPEPDRRPKAERRFAAAARR